MIKFGRPLNSLFLAAAVLALANCGGSPHSVDERYFVVATNIKLPYWQSAAAGFFKAARELQVKADMVGPNTYDPKAQHEEFQKLLGENPTGILVSPADPVLMKPDIDAAIERGIPVITFDSDDESSKRLFFIGTDNYRAGLMAGELAAKELDGKGNVVIYTMPEQANLKQRLRGYQEAFSAHPEIKIVETVDIKGDPRIAFDRTREIVRAGKLKPDAYICLEAIACPEIADERTLEWIRKGNISATIAQKPYTMAFVGLKMLDDLHHHLPTPLSADWREDSFSPMPVFVDTGATLIDKGNVEHFLQAQKTATSKQ
jgi:ribose transport system substrate-binding protein